MKPLSAESKDSKSLQALGRASVQIVHDLKNQINGLKLYATFLKKRLEKTERAADELETVGKLIAGLDRTAGDLSMIVRLGQTLELRKQPGIDLHKLLSGISIKFNENPPTSGALTRAIVLHVEPGHFAGEFDSEALSEALEWITLGAVKILATSNSPEQLHIHLKRAVIESRTHGIIEWGGFDLSGHDPFQSFVGSNGIKMSMAARVVEAHGGFTESDGAAMRVRLPLAR